MDSDTCYMSCALDLARQGLGRVAPNPSVGCVLVGDAGIVAQARTADGGRPHAEAAALDLAGDVKGATAYVTLEPCFYPDRPFCCASRLIGAGVKKVVIGCLDENPAIHGKGVSALRQAGIEVVTGCLEEESRFLNRGFFLCKNQGRPLVTLKTATSLDSKIAALSGESRWITGEESRAMVHRLRASHDAILTGIGTVLVDDPELTTRVPGLEHKSVRVVLDTHLRMPPSSRMLKTKDRGEVIVFTSSSKNDTLPDATIVTAPQSPDGHMDISFVLKTLASRGITRLMVETGQEVLSSFLRHGLWDDLYIVRAPIILGADGRDAFGALGVNDLSDGLRPKLLSREACGEDLVEYYTRPI